MDKVKFIGISDWRIQPLELIDEIIRKERPDFVLYGGDDLNRFAVSNCYQNDRNNYNVLQNANDSDLETFFQELIIKIKDKQSIILEFSKQFETLDRREKYHILKNLKKRKHSFYWYFTINGEKVTYIDLFSKINQLNEDEKNSIISNLNRGESKRWIRLVFGNEKLSTDEIKVRFNQLNDEQKFYIIDKLEGIEKCNSPGMILQILEDIKMNTDLAVEYFDPKINTLKHNLNLCLGIIESLRKRVNSIFSEQETLLDFQYNDNTYNLNINKEEIRLKNSDVIGILIEKIERKQDFSLLQKQTQKNSKQQLLNDKSKKNENLKLNLLVELLNDFKELLKNDTNLDNLINLIKSKKHYKKKIKHEIVDYILSDEFQTEYNNILNKEYLFLEIILKENIYRFDTIPKSVKNQLIFRFKTIIKPIGINWKLKIKEKTTEKDLIKVWNKQLPLGFFYILGNDDEPNFRLQKPALFLEESPILTDKWVILGISGSPEKDHIGYTLFNEDLMLNQLNNTIQKYRDKNIIILSHTPPYGVLDLSLRFGPEHIGSIAIRKIIEKNPNIKLVICGHSHLWNGMVNHIQNTKIINISNQDDEKFKNIGNYVLLTLEDYNFEAEIKKVGCDWQRISGIGPERIKKLPLLYQPFETLNLNGLSNTIIKRLKLYTEYLKRNENSIIDLLKREDLANQDDFLASIKLESIFLDIETEAITTMGGSGIDGTYVIPPYIASISLIHLKNNAEKYFLSIDYNSQKAMVDDFRDYISRFIGKIYAWTGFDQRVLKAHNFNRDIIDLKEIVKNSVVLPNYTLKDVEKYLGIKRQEEVLDISGTIIGAMVSHVLKPKIKDQQSKCYLTKIVKKIINNECPICKNFLTKYLINYNMEDVRSMIKIVEILRGLNPKI